MSSSKPHIGTDTYLGLRGPGGDVAAADRELWRTFRAACRANGRTLAATIRLLIRVYLREAQNDQLEWFPRGPHDPAPLPPAGGGATAGGAADNPVSLAKAAGD